MLEEASRPSRGVESSSSTSVLALIRLVRTGSLAALGHDLSNSKLQRPLGRSRPPVSVWSGWLVDVVVRLA